MVKKKKAVSKRVNKVVKRSVKKKKKVACSKVVQSKKQKQSSISKKDFATFSFGVERLKELKTELNSIDTRGFSKEDQDIRGRLKNVSEIPTIEKKIKTLKLKVHRRFRPKRKRKSKILKEIKDLKMDTQKIPVLRREIGSLKKQAEAKSKKPVVDSGVDILIDSNFNSFLKETKASLSERIRSREKAINQILKTDLEKREQKFKEKHDNLIRDFNDKKRSLHEQLENNYNLKVKRELGKEIAEKFNSVLKKKLDAEKVSLGRKYIAELRAHANEKLVMDEQKLFQRAQEELSNKINELENKKQAEVLKLERVKEKELLKLERKKKKELLKLERKKEKEIDAIEIGDKKLQQGKQNFALYKSAGEKIIKNKLADEMNRLRKRKQEELLNFEKLKQIEKGVIDNKMKKLQQDKQNFVLQKVAERKSMKDKLVDEFHKNLEQELGEKERVLREQLGNEFELKLKKDIQIHEDDLKKRKIDLELEFQKRIKQVLD